MSHPARSGPAGTLAGRSATSDADVTVRRDGAGEEAQQ